MQQPKEEVSMQAILVRVGKMSEIKDYPTYKSILRALGIKSHQEYETMELKDLPTVGIIAKDQDIGGLKQNRLGIKGDFIILGMERISGHYAFQGLEDKQALDLRLSLTLTTYKDAITALNGGE
jgi:hypothetical protein